MGARCESQWNSKVAPAPKRFDNFADVLERDANSSTKLILLQRLNVIIQAVADVAIVLSTTPPKPTVVMSGG